MYGQKSSLWDGKSLEDHLRGLSYFEGEHQLSEEDTVRVSHALALWLLIIADIAPTYDLERTYSMANLVRWPDRPRLDIVQLLGETKECLAVIRDYDPNMGRPGFRAYKAWLQERLAGNMVYNFLKPYFHRLYGGEATVFRDLNTMLQFWSRLTLRDTSWLVEDLETSYVVLEEEMTHWVYPDSLLDCLRYIVTEWFQGFSLDGARPFFSNGATAEVKRGMGVASKVKRGSRTIDLVLADTMLSYSSPYYIGMTLGYIPCAEWQDVPKGIDKRRGISKEPTANQYYQSAFFSRCREWFVDHPNIGVRLEDQDLSRSMALQGSSDGKYSTVDLSSASDTVTWRLVLELFRDLPEISRYLRYTRTEFVKLPTRGVIRMNKFAPMGSIDCFPMECVVFAAAASYACWVSGIPQNFRVYGDDIVIDSRAYEAVLDILGRLNFVVNTDKSYGPTSIFLEACGIEAYKGFDVTPCRLSRQFDVVKLRRGKSPQQYQGSIEFANRLYAYGFSKARRYLIRDLLAVFPLTPFSVDPEKGVYHPDPDNQHLPRRVICRGGKGKGARYYRTEVLVQSTKSTVKRGPDRIRYIRTLEAIENRTEAPRPDLRLCVNCGPTRDSLCKKWVSLLDYL